MQTILKKSHKELHTKCTVSVTFKYVHPFFFCRTHRRGAYQYTKKEEYVHPVTNSESQNYLSIAKHLRLMTQT